MIGRIKADIQSLGVRVSASGSARKAGAGPAEGQVMFLDGVPANVPISAPYVLKSPYHLKNKGNDIMLFKDENQLTRVTIQQSPEFYKHFTDDGIGYNRIALKHGGECLATTVFQRCIYWNSPNRCRFCGIELSLKNNSTVEKKTPQQLSEVARAAKELDGIRHVVLTTGAFRFAKKGIEYIKKCAQSISSSTNLPIHVQIEPPAELVVLRELKEAGVSSIGIHIESFDFNVLSEIAPVKASLGLKRYTKAWERSVEIFGYNQVSSFLIVGLGENHRSIIEGSKYLAERGIYPFLVPLRPIPGSLLMDSLPPPPDLMIKLYEKVSEILNRNSVYSKKNKAGCVRCGACSALPEFEK